MPRKYTKPKKFKKKRSVFRSKFLWGLVIFAFFSSGAGYVIFLSPYFQIREVRVDGVKLVQEKDIQALVGPFLERNVLFLKSKPLALLDTSAIENTLMGALPLLATVNAQREMPDTLRISAKERQSLVPWCQRSQTCFALDREGVAFKEYSVQTEFYLRDSAKEMAKVGDTVIAEEFLSSLLRLKSDLESSNFFQQSELRLSSIALISKERFNLRFPGEWEAYFTSEEDLAWQRTKLLLVLEEKIPPKKRAGLEYIDLRFGDQAYIKYKSSD